MAIEPKSVYMNGRSHSLIKFKVIFFASSPELVTVLFSLPSHLMVSLQMVRDSEALVIGKGAEGDKLICQLYAISFVSSPRFPFLTSYTVYHKKQAGWHSLLCVGSPESSKRYQYQKWDCGFCQLHKFTSQQEFDDLQVETVTLGFFAFHPN